MIQRGIATFGLDFGTCPRWLFERMKALGRQMTEAMAAEEGPDEFIRAELLFLFLTLKFFSAGVV